jgi:ADP-dependent NAD(P)H-hydrate dehydratase
VKRPIELTRRSLRKIPLPEPNASSDKDARGRVLAIGGCSQVPGSIVLAGVAALRAGAGKLQLATVSSVAPALGIAVPESLVVALPESRNGEIAGARAVALLREYAGENDAVLVGPGMSSDRAAHALIAPLVRRMCDDATLVLDAAAILALRHEEGMLLPLAGRAVLTPHTGEMASLLGVEKDDIESDPPSAARLAAERFGALVVLKGAESWIAQPDGIVHHFDGGSVGLATSGSGDTLAGIVVGLAARGAPAAHAAMWAVYLHAAAGRVLAKRMGRIGFLARELLDEIPMLVEKLGK